jgi:deoxyribonuclease V
MAEAVGWPSTAAALIALQSELAGRSPPPWSPSGSIKVAGCAICFARRASAPGCAGEPGWAGAALWDGGAIVETGVVHGAAGAAFEPGLLALREGPLLEAALRSLRQRPDVVLVNATGRDHPRRAGLALHLGAVLEIPTAGVTRQPLLAAGSPPGEQRGDRSPLLLDGECVAVWLRAREKARPIVVHGGWRVAVETGADLVLAVAGSARTPEPLREARRLARTARASL